MTYQIIYAPRSRRDLEKIFIYLSDESGDLALANRFLERLFEACDSLSVFPARFAPYPYARNWRMMPFEGYLVFFEIAEDKVRIGHIRHGARSPYRG